MILDLKNCMKHGAYSNIFLSMDARQIFKLFISSKHETNVTQEIRTPEKVKVAREKRRRETFASECDAYHLAMKDEFLQLHVPHFSERLTLMRLWIASELMFRSSIYSIAVTAA